MKRPLYPCAGLLLPILAACTTVFDAFPSSTSLSDQWSEKMVQFRVVPVGMPSEDIQVGDIYTTCELTQPDSSGRDGFLRDFQPFVLWVHRLHDMKTALDAHYENSIKMRTNPPPGAASSASVTTDQIVPKNLSLPEFFQIRARGSHVSGLLPVGSVLGGLGYSDEDVESVDVAITSAGTLSLPYLSMNDEVRKLSDAEARAIEVRQDKYHQDVCAKDPHQRPLKATTRVVTQIYAAYAITVTANLRKQSALASQAALTLPSDSTRKAAFDALVQHFSKSPASSDAASGPGNAASAPSTASAPGNPDSAPSKAQATQEDAAARDARFLAALQSLMGQTQDISQTYPGVSVKVYRGTSAGVRMDRQLTSPVVIGVRSLPLVFEDGTEIVEDQNHKPVLKTRRIAHLGGPMRGVTPPTNVR
jgi:hypothetical protein